MNCLEWQDLFRSRKYDARIFTVEEVRRRSADGKEAGFTVLKSPDWVNIIAPVRSADGKRAFLMVRQFRHGSGRLTTEFPAGMIEPGEEPASAAAREFEEETGYTASSYRLIGVCNPNPAFMSNRVYTFLAETAVPSGIRHLDEHEMIDVLTVPEEVVLNCLGSEEFDNGIMLVAGFFYRRFIEKTGSYKDPVSEGSDRI